MNHTITINTIEALILNKALTMELHNDKDNEMAERLIQRIRDTVANDLREKGE